MSLALIDLEYSFSKTGCVVNGHLAHLLTSGHPWAWWDLRLCSAGRLDLLVFRHSLKKPGAMLDMAQCRMESRGLHLDPRFAPSHLCGLEYGTGPV